MADGNERRIQKWALKTVCNEQRKVGADRRISQDKESHIMLKKIGNVRIKIRWGGGGGAFM
jgi:hypothetical protein